MRIPEPGYRVKITENQAGQAGYEGQVSRINLPSHDSPFISRVVARRYAYALIYEGLSQSESYQSAAIEIQILHVKPDGSEELCEEFAVHVERYPMPKTKQASR